MGKRKRKPAVKPPAKATDAPPPVLPFRAMKASLIETVRNPEPAPPVAPAAPAPAPAPPPIDDAELFAREMAHVRPISGGPAPRSRPVRPVAERPKAARMLDAEAEFSALMEAEDQGWRAAGLSVERFDDLRLGRLTVQRSQDLHGLRAATAERAVRALVAEARTRRLSCVLVIHGRGKNSGDEGPVLRDAVRRWLRTPPLSADVLAWAPALAHEGGAGATRVLVRED